MQLPFRVRPPGIDTDHVMRIRHTPTAFYSSGQVGHTPGHSHCHILHPSWMEEKIPENGLVHEAAPGPESSGAHLHLPSLSVNLRDLATVSDKIRPGVCFRSSQVISSSHIRELNVRVCAPGGARSGGQVRSRASAPWAMAGCAHSASCPPLPLQTVLDLRQSPMLCKAFPNNSAQTLRHAAFKGRIWFAGVVRLVGGVTETW